MKVPLNVDMVKVQKLQKHCLRMVVQRLLSPDSVLVKSSRKIIVQQSEEESIIEWMSPVT